MPAMRTLAVNFVAHTSEFKAGADRVRNDLRSVGQETRQTGQSVTSMWSAFKVSGAVMAFEKGFATGTRALQLYALTVQRNIAGMAGQTVEYLQLQRDVEQSWRDTMKLIPGAGQMVDAYFDAWGRSKEMAATITKIKEARTATEQLRDMTREWGDQIELAEAKKRGAKPKEIAEIQVRQDAQARGRQILVEQDKLRERRDAARKAREEWEKGHGAALAMARQAAENPPKGEWSGPWRRYVERNAPLWEPEHQYVQALEQEVRDAEAALEAAKKQSEVKKKLDLELKVRLSDEELRVRYLPGWREAHAPQNNVGIQGH